MDVIDLVDLDFDEFSSDEDLDHALPQRRFRERIDAFTHYSDAEFKLRYRFHKETVRQLILLLEDDLQRNTKRNRSLSVETQVLLTLRFVACGGFQREDADLHGVTQPTVSRIVHPVLRAIAGLKDRFISFPTDEEFQGIQKAFYRQNGIPGVLGAIDGTHIHIVNPGGPDAEIYRNRKGRFSINTQILTDHNMTIRNIVASWPGSAHDSRIFNESALKTRLEELPGKFHILGDQGYPCLRYLLIPLQVPRTASEKRYNFAQSSTRMVVERLNGAWKRRFPCLGQELRFTPEKCGVVIVACAVLHNLARMNADDFDEVEQSDDQNEDMGDNGPHADAEGAAKRRQIITDHFLVN